MSNTATETHPTPPSVPSVSRETGAVTITRPEDKYADGGYQGWSPSENPFEGGPAHKFNDAEPAKQKANAAKAFNEKSNSII